MRTISYIRYFRQLTASSSTEMPALYNKKGRKKEKEFEQIHCQRISYMGHNLNKQFKDDVYR